MDDGNNLTIFIVNNSPSTDLTAEINISGMTAGTDGERWLIEPAGPTQAGGTTVQDKEDLQINGIFHPAPTTVNSLAPQTFTSGNTFTISLPKSCMIFLKVPWSGEWLYGDLTHDNIVDMDDLYEFSLVWLVSDCNNVELDLNGDCIINFYEYSFFAQNWLKGF